MRRCLTLIRHRRIFMSASTTSSSSSSSSSTSKRAIAAIDQGTSSTRVVCIDTAGRVVAQAQKQFESIHPKPAWTEQDPMVLLTTVRECLSECESQLRANQFNLHAIGVTNQRETTVVWDRATGKPLHNAIVWLDTRTGDIVDAMSKQLGGPNVLQQRCGLPIATYFSGLKLRWLRENVPAVAQAMQDGSCLAGTVDSWLIWNLTGGAANGGVHVTDVTNASRTMLMNLRTCQWDDILLKHFGVPRAVLPTIKSSAEVYGKVHDGPFAGVPVAACLGDQQAALVGQRCFKTGDAKNTYGTGCFLLLNTGTSPVFSRHGLLTTAAYQLGPTAPVHYALEGSIAIAGAGIDWLVNKMGLVADAAELNTLASSVPSTGDVYFVPAFSGLYAPHWRDDARGLIVGLTQFTERAHICRALLEATCFQTREVLDAMHNDSGVQLNKLRVDGGMTKSSLLLQLQADLLNIDVERPDNGESTALGAAYAAGLATGVWSDVAALEASVSASDASLVVKPRASEQAQVPHRYARWMSAVQRSFGWKERK